jgi:hemin uptake protein HemP
MNDPKSSNARSESESAAETEQPPRIIVAQELFAGQREICIEHDGERYRLRITRRGKLILQK